MSTMADPSNNITAGTGPEMWTSKLGNRYPKADIEARHEETMHELHHLLAQGENAVCADCGQTGGRTIWSSVNLGVFLCMHCGSLHRALGTHISKPKGCSGTYLWGPDEMAQMYRVGNARAREIYGDGGTARPSRDASDAVWLKFLQEKYVQKKYAPRTTTAGTATVTLHRYHPSPYDMYPSVTESSATTVNEDVAHVFQDLLDDSHYPHATGQHPHPPSGAAVAGTLSPRSSISHNQQTHNNATQLHSSPIDPHHKPTTNDFFAEFGV